MIKKETILLVEDNPDEAELAQRGFARFSDHYDIALAQNGEDALDFLFAQGKHQDREAERKPRLVIVDISLPGMDGFAVVKTLRAHPDYRHTPIVILTTSDERSDVLAGYNLGANSYLCKPVDFSAFADLLASVSHYWLQNNLAPD